MNDHNMPRALHSQPSTGSTAARAPHNGRNHQVMNEAGLQPTAPYPPDQGSVSVSANLQVSMNLLL